MPNHTADTDPRVPGGLNMVRTIGTVVVSVALTAGAFVGFTSIRGDGVTAGPASTIGGQTSSTQTTTPESTVTSAAPPTSESTTTTTATIAPAVVDRLGQLTGWVTPIAITTDDRAGEVSSGVRVVGDNFRGETVCRPQGLRIMSTVFSEFPVGAFSGNALPGLVVEGAGIDDADLRVVPLARAPFELVSSADSFNNVQLVESPQTADIQQAVTALKRDADSRLNADGVDVVSSDITYAKAETHSFEESTLELGISLHYESLTRSASFEGAFELDEAVQRHSIVVRMVQPMFRISMQRDGISSPGDYFSADVTESELDALEASGRLGAENPPVVIDSVTYGRVMYYTLTSTQVESASELSAVVDGSYRGIDGEASLTARQREVLASSEVQLISYGGDQDLALEAIRSGDLSRYFGPANAATAAPLTMTMRTLDGTSVDVADEATLQEVVCTDTARPYEFRVAVSNIDNGAVSVTTAGGGRIGSASEGSYASGVNNILKTIPGDLLSWGWNELTFSFTASVGGCSNVFDAEEFEASIRSRATVGSGDWSTRTGRISFDENECGTRTFKRWVNTTTGDISTSKPT